MKQNRAEGDHNETEKNTKKLKTEQKQTGQTRRKYDKGNRVKQNNSKKKKAYQS